MKCASCGADMSPTDMQCSHCGSHRPTPKNSQAAVFARIKGSDQYAHRNSPERLARLPKISAMQKVFFSIFFVIFIGSAAFASVMMLGMAGVFGFAGFRGGGRVGSVVALAPLLMALFPIGFVVLGVFLFRHVKAKMDSLENDPVEAIPVVIIGKRTQVSGGGSNSSASTHYFITCEGEDGERREYQVWGGGLYGKLADEDAGILFVRGGYGLDFDRVAG